MDKKPLTEQEIAELDAKIMAEAGHLNNPHVLMVRRSENGVELDYKPITAVLYLADASEAIRSYFNKCELKHPRLTDAVFWSFNYPRYIEIIDGIRFEFELIQVDDIQRECKSNPGFKYLEHMIAQSLKKDSCYLFVVGYPVDEGKGFTFRSKIFAPTYPAAMLSLLGAAIQGILASKETTLDELLDRLREISKDFVSVKHPRYPVQ